MKLPETLNPNERQWDRWKAFYWGYGPNGVTISTWSNPPVVIFETGEVVVTWNCTAVGVRQNYFALNLQLVGTADPKCPAMQTPDGRPIPRAWLTQGGAQNLLVDYCTKRVVAVGGTQNPAWAQTCPGRFVTSRNGSGAPQNWNIQAWIPGVGQNPFGFGLINLSIPSTNKDWTTPEQREHVATIVAVCNAMMSLQNAPRWHSPGLAFERVLEVSEVSELTSEEQLALFQGGVKRKLVQVDHLVLAE